MFQIGKSYLHTNGKKLTVITGACTSVHGWCLIAETDKGELMPVGNHEGAFIGWSCLDDSMISEEQLA